MSEQKEKVFCGNAKIITTQYGDLTKISFNRDDLRALTNNLKNDWVNAVIKKKQNPVEGKPTHYLEIDFWQPKEGSNQPANLNSSEDDDDLLPF